MWGDFASDEDMEETEALTLNTGGEWTDEDFVGFGVEKVTITDTNEDSTFNVKKSDDVIVESVTRKYLFVKLSF